MPDVFISYARADRKRVAPIAAALEAEGFSVWWDAAIKPGKEWHDTIRRHLSGAHCVLVCWTRASAKSDWVLAETTQAYNQRKLIPVLLHDVDPPMPYNMVQSANLAPWRGDPDDPEWVAVLREVRALVEKSRKLAGAPPPPGEAHGAEFAPRGLGRATPAPPPPPPVVAEPEMEAFVYEPSAKRGRFAPRVTSLVAGALLASAALTGMIWAGPSVVRMAQGLIPQAAPPPAVARFETVAAPAAETLPAPSLLALAPPLSANPAAFAEPAPPSAKPNVQIEAPKPEARPVSPPRTPALPPDPPPVLTPAEFEPCLGAIASACGGRAKGFEADGRLSANERALLANFPEPGALTPANLKTCQTLASGAAARANWFEKACAGINTAPPKPSLSPLRPTLQAKPDVPVRAVPSAAPPPAIIATRPALNTQAAQPKSSAPAPLR